MPLPRSAVVALIVRMTPSTGPMQGVQPKAKASPRQEGADDAAALDVGMEPRLALEQVQRQEAGEVQAEQEDDDAGQDAELVAPARSRLPRAVALAPRAMKTAEKPRTKHTA